MDTKKHDGFLTCLEACDTIAMFAELAALDYNAFLFHSGELTDAFAVIIGTDLTSLPDQLIDPIARMQGVVYEFLGIEALGDYENFNSSTRH